MRLVCALKKKNHVEKENMFLEGERNELIYAI
jgi:hypothetical protein